MVISARPLVWLTLAVWAGCAVQPPEGVFVCSSRADCPDGMDCVRDRCRRVSDAGVDAPPPDVPLEDTPVDGDAFVPSDTVDAPVGPCDSVLTSSRGTQVHGTGEERSGNLIATTGGLTFAMSYAGTFLTLPAMLFDGQVATLGADSSLMLEGNVSGSGDSHVRAVASTAEGIVAVGTTTLDSSFDLAAPTAAIGLAGFVYRPVGATARLIQASSSGNRVEPTTITTRTDGLVCIGGAFDGSPSLGFTAGHVASGLDGFVSCLDRDLAIVSGVPIAGPGDQRVTAIVSDGAGGLYVAGSSSGPITIGVGSIPIVSPEDGFVVHLDAALRLSESFVFGANRGRSIVHGVVHVDGIVYAVGELGPGAVAGPLRPLLFGRAGGSIDALLVRLDASLTPTSALVADQGDYDAFFAVAVDRCGRPVVAGGLGGFTPDPLGLVPLVRVYDDAGVSAFEAIGDLPGGYFSGVAVDGDGRISAFGTYRNALQIDGQAFPLNTGDGPTELMVLELF